MMRIKLKVCGITSIEDARAAIDCGASYLGFNFYSKSPRYVELETARWIIEQLPPEIIAVGVFVNLPEPDQVIEGLRLSGAQIAQLHGDEDASYCAQVGPERVIKAFRIGPDFRIDLANDFPSAALLLDAYDKNLYGGTGKTANWEIAREVAKRARVFLAGGLSPENISEAVETVKPFAVDVNSGVEILPGRKDPEKLKRLKEEMKKL